MLLYVGLTDATPIVTALLDLSGLEDLTGLETDALLLAGRCVAEAVRLDADARTKVLERLEAAFTTCTNDDFARIGQVLADIAGEDSVAFFLKTAHEQPNRRNAALWTLGEMAHQPDEALRERVIERLLEHFQEGDCQQEAGMALIQVWELQILNELRARQRTILVEKTERLLPEWLDTAMIVIPAGEFLMGDNKRKVRVDTFRIDKYPVTHMQYKRFLDANPDHRVPYVDEKWAQPYNWDQRARTYPPDKADHPVVLVSWRDAQAYAQ